MKKLVSLSGRCLASMIFVVFASAAFADEQPLIVPTLKQQWDLSALTKEEQTAEEVALVYVNVTPKVEECPLTTDYKDDEYEKNPNELVDPLERANRVVDMLNREVLYKGLFRPLTLGVKWIAPEFMLTGLNNAFYNAREPVNFINSLFQLQPKRFGLGVVRFVFNTTIGLAGLFDPSCDWLEICRMEADFGQTLGFWGIGSGPYVVLPIFGPSSARGIFGLTGDLAMTPMTYIGYYYPDFLRDLSLLALERVVKLSYRYSDLDQIYDTFEPYVGTKHAYENCEANKVIEAKKR